MIDGRAATQAFLKACRVFAEVMQKAGLASNAGSAEFFTALPGQSLDRQQIVFERLPP
jgi:hypothetical protein